jgi:radical SAM superfamily enzyme YgiQ (UPF0313 family)
LFLAELKKIGLVQVDGKWPNLALMKLSAWHKKHGDDVTLLDLSGFHFDRVYASQIFVGGSGVNLKSELPEDIEVQVPDYDLFKRDYKIGFTSRGCIRDCGFCIVKEKEGGIRETPFDWAETPKVILLDNNFLASPRWKEKLEYFIRHRVKVCFSQGLDIRLVDSENAKLLAQVKYYDSDFKTRRLYFAFDFPELDPVIREKVAILSSVGIPKRHLMFYMLIGYNTSFEEDYHRFEIIHGLGCLPFVMIFNNRRDDRLLRDFARWVNQRYYKHIEWPDYDPKKRNR